MTTFQQLLQRARDAWLAGMTISDLYNCDPVFAAVANNQLTIAEIEVLAYEQAVLNNTLKLNTEFSL